MAVELIHAKLNRGNDMAGDAVHLPIQKESILERLKPSIWDSRTVCRQKIL